MVSVQARHSRRPKPTVTFLSGMIKKVIKLMMATIDVAAPVEIVMVTRRERSLDEVRKHCHEEAGRTHDWVWEKLVRMERNSLMSARAMPISVAVLRLVQRLWVRSMMVHMLE
jgi:hypothetical protein